MSKRSKIPFQKSKRDFSRSADRTHKFNLNMRSMRGGGRL